MDAVLQMPGEGERHGVGASEALVKVGSAETGGTFYLAETTIAPDFPGPPPHTHERLHDMFYVLEGRLTMRLGEETRELGPGSFACVPPGVVHTFSNKSASPVRMLNFNTPGGWENYMRDLAEAAQSGPLTPEAIGQIASKYDFRAA